MERRTLLGTFRQDPSHQLSTDRSTAFENRYSEAGRTQFLLHRAPVLDFYQIPETWRTAGIVHLGPVAQEVEPGIVRNFPSGFIGVTPQGWMRSWDEQGKVHSVEWPEAEFVLSRAGGGGDQCRGCRISMKIGLMKWRHAHRFSQ